MCHLPVGITLSATRDKMPHFSTHFPLITSWVVAFIRAEKARGSGEGGEKALTDAAYALTDAAEKARG